jgi:hypothetical protein
MKWAVFRTAPNARLSLGYSCSRGWTKALCKSTLSMLPKQTRTGMPIWSALPATLGLRSLFTWRVAPPQSVLHFAAAGTACPDKSTASTVFLVIKLACVRVSLGIFFPSAASTAR